MKTRRDTLERIAAALERLAPASTASTDWLSHPAYVWEGETARPVASLDTVGLDKLRGIETQKRSVLENLQRLASGAAAHDMLLWGSRGMGKSALIRAAVAEQSPASLALVQFAPGTLHTFAQLVDELSEQDRAFLLFIDDLGFAGQDSEANFALRSLLDGGLAARASRIRLAVTSNRRAIIGRDASEGDALHERDERDNALALADRFGLTLAFHPCDRETYLEILRAYTTPLDLDFDEEEALAWAIQLGNRSGRTAYQFACELAGRAGLAL